METRDGSKQEQYFMNIRQAEKADSRSIARLHKEEIRKGFLSSLGMSFLAKLYELIGNDEGSCVLVAEENNTIIGFVAGTIDIQAMYRRIIMRKWMLILLPLLRFMINLKVVKKMIETIVYGFKNKGNKTVETAIAAELLSVAVKKEVQGRGIGKKMVAELEAFYRRHTIKRYRVVTYSLDRQSNRFYCACQFSSGDGFSHHGNIMNEYTKEII